MYWWEVAINNCLHKCYMRHDEGIYIGTEYRNSDGTAMFCYEKKMILSDAIDVELLGGRLELCKSVC